ncbi:hypothetical protein ACCO45_001176 [Purpureocillium lilacinum]|uniref:Uncharacterized protein n=1 Tax=Purpureocillium lilacinum TaxID=33203 RepID=A0ACC4E7M3_PURLI
MKRGISTDPLHASPRPQVGCSGRLGSWVQRASLRSSARGFHAPSPRTPRFLAQRCSAESALVVSRISAQMAGPREPLDKGLAKTCREVGHLCPSSARASRRLEGRYIWYGEEADPLRFAAPDTNGWHRSPGLPCPPDRRVPHRPWEPIMTPARGHAAGALSVLQRACLVAPSSFALAQACLPTDGYPPDAVRSPLRSGRLSVPSQTTTYSRLPSVCPGSLTVIRTPPALLQRWSLCLFPVTSGHIPCPPAAAEGILPPERQAARAVRSSNAYQSLAAR